MDQDPEISEVLNDIKQNLAKGLRQSARNKKQNATSPAGPVTNELRVKCEYQEEKRIIQIQSPIRYSDLLNKIKQYYGSALCIHYPISDGECYIPIRNQDELEQAISLWERSEYKRSLRVKLSREEDGLDGGIQSIQAKDLFKGNGNGETSRPQGGEAKGSSPTKQSTPGRYSPPPGTISPKEIRNLQHSSSFSSSTGGGEFIPEEVAEDACGVGPYPVTSPDGSLASSRTSLDSSYLTSTSSIDTYPFRGKGGRRSVASDTTYEEMMAQERDYPKGGTYPSRYRNTTAPEKEGRKTFPFRHRGPEMENRYGHHFGGAGSERSLSTSSSSSGLAHDLDSPDQGRRRRETPRAPTNWKKGRLLGAGAFGQVFLCYDADTGRELAVKQVVVSAINAEISKEMRALEAEIQLLKNLQHDRIVQYYGSFQDDKILSIFMEYMPGGSVKDELRNYGALTEKVTRKYTAQILHGVIYLHQHMIVHRDVKCANILRDSIGNIKLADFGASKRLHTICPSMGLKSVTGTPYYMSPEVINGDGYGRKADVWSVGCTVVEMLTKAPPWAEFEGMAAIFKIAMSDHPKYELPGHVTPVAVDFLKLTFKKSPSERPTAEDLYRHEFCTEQL
ncbi:mitogen-activated protein kinase kinase kinase 2-like isoform X2 [Lineus longissimus]|uniref:mitogen-activated protein kinase kinase kinase 2-like isoform X2 n=1 Tax=Lineus longissimus TaxID=88925 RepID=UPI00315CF9C6